MIWFIEGGPWMYAILVTDLVVGSAAGVVLLIAILSRFAPVARWPARIVSGLVLLGSALPALGGAIGWWTGLSAMEQAVAHAADEHKEALRAAGEAMAIIPMYFGGASTLVLGLLGTLAFVVAALPHRADHAD